MVTRNVETTVVVDVTVEAAIKVAVADAEERAGLDEIVAVSSRNGSVPSVLLILIAEYAG